MVDRMNSQIDGVIRYELNSHTDGRGELVEIFRTEWLTHFAPVQWTLTVNNANVLRGFHCHVRHTDLLLMVDGTMILGLKDLRIDSPTHDVAIAVELKPLVELIEIPPGVGHGFYFPGPATVLNAVSHEWSKHDELGCRWDDPALDVAWGCESPILSERDRTAGTLAELRRVVQT